jgi:hypothetical protein
LCSLVYKAEQGLGHVGDGLGNWVHDHLFKGLGVIRFEGGINLKQKEFCENQQATMMPIGYIHPPSLECPLGSQM